MNKVGFLIISSAFSLTCHNLMAQEEAHSVVQTDEASGFFILPKNVDLYRNAIKNPDGSITIKAGQQTHELMELSRKYCERLGGTSIDNDSDATIKLEGSDFGISFACTGDNLSKNHSSSVLVPPDNDHIYIPIPKLNWLRPSG